MSRATKKETKKTISLFQSQAIAALEKGKTVSQYQEINFNLPAPPLLRSAWKYKQAYSFGIGDFTLSQLYGFLSDYLTEETAQQHDDNILRATAAQMGVGYNAVNSVLRSFTTPHFDIRETWLDERVYQLLSGLNGYFMPYEFLKASQMTRPDERKAKLLADNEKTMTELKSLEKEVMKK